MTTTTMEFQYHAHDALNPGFGGAFEVTAGGLVIQRELLTYQQAAFVLGAAIAACDEARRRYPDTDGHPEHPEHRHENDELRPGHYVGDDCDMDEVESR